MPTPEATLTPFFTNERKKTDDSLIAERDRTNESLLHAREATETKTDTHVTADRAAADESTTSSREDADAVRDKNRGSANYTVQDEKKNSDARLIEERRRADIAIKLERTYVDTAFDVERDLKSALAVKLLERERGTTDLNLKDERFQTDSEANQSSHLLSDERAGHSQTKISLTSRDEFIAIVSHDLRNPIGSVSACADMLLTDESFEKIDDETKHWIAFIKRNADASLRLITDLLDVEKIAQGKIIVFPKMNCLGEVVKEVVETFSLAASTKSVLLRVVPYKPACDLIFDRDRIAQVLSNLIGNALKFTPDTGSINVSIVDSEGDMKVSITDSGAGIPPEKLEQVFERFAQLGSKDRSGLGLGLYISKTIIEAHRGKIWVESVFGSGSTFSFSLPRISRVSQCTLASDEKAIEQND